MAVPSVDDLIGVVSPSKLENAARCDARFLFGYVERLPRPFRADAQHGNAIDTTGNLTYEEKLRRGRTPAKRQVAEIFAAQWDFEAGAIDDWQGQDRGALLDVGVHLVKTWRDDIAQHCVPESTQRRMRQRVIDEITGDTFELEGVVDMIGSTVVPRAVADLKGSSRAYRADRMLRSFQPVSYTLLAGTPVFEFHVLVRTRHPYLQVLRATIPDSERRAFLHRAALIRRRIASNLQTGNWLPNRAEMLCSRRYCPYWRACEKRFGGTVPA